jgi:uncharacterized membrane protein YuzA (DUF378 family)
VNFNLVEWLFGTGSALTMLIYAGRHFGLWGITMLMSDKSRHADAKDIKLAG